MYLTQGLHRAVQRHPQATALSHRGESQTRRLSWLQLQQAVSQQAALLARQGVMAGDRVALLGGNSDRLICAILACWWRGAVACPLNTRWTATELRQALEDSTPGAFWCDEALAELATTASTGLALTPLGFTEVATQAAACEPLADTRTGGEALAALLYTGGTTGRSKGVMLTHANFWSASVSRAAELPNPPDGVSLLVAPLFHVAGLGRLIGQQIAGAPCVTLPAFRADAVLEAIVDEHIGDIIFVPSMLQMLLDHPGFDAAAVQSLKRIAFGAAPMPPDLLQRALATWPQAEFFQAYGMTETAGAVCINLPEAQRAGTRSGSVGRAGLGAEIRIVDAAGQDCAPGTVGEIIVRGPMVTSGYWRQPEASAQALRNGWLHTGDGGHIDGEGWLTLVDRLKDMIISGGENVYSAEVEAALRAHDEVADAAVIGLPDARWGERVCAVVVRRGGLPADQTAQQAFAEQLQAWCRERLAGYKCPRQVFCLDALPLSAAGKVLKTSLRAQFRETPSQPGPAHG
ncbi:MAG: AMP-binding protein [Burkholderiaceae bacterium]|nr:AMP-binding protein [Burkholderiaceae bacterium]